MYLTNRLVRLGLATALCVTVFVSQALAEGPATQPMPIFSEGLESTLSQSYPVISAHIDARHPLAPYPMGYWGRVTARKHAGSYGLWVAGNNPALTSYPRGTAGDARISIPSLENYYSSSLSFWYTMASVGLGDGDSFIVGWTDTAVPNYPDDHRDFPVTGAGVWTQRSYDMGTGKVPLSRRPGALSFFFYDNVNDLPPATGEGPTIDDIVVNGWKYGSPRALNASLKASTIDLGWSRPYRTTTGSTTEDRDLSYRVYMAPTGSGDWSEIGSRLETQGATAGLSLAYPGEGRSYTYAVQAWDPGSGTGYGRHTALDVNVPATPPSVAVSQPVAGFVLSSGAVSIQGTASDTGVGVAAVDVRIRRADGLCWNPVSGVWSATDHWIPASSTDGWSTWSYSWTPDQAVLESGRIVSVTARARDGASLSSSTAAVNSAAPIIGSVSLDGGSPFASSAQVNASISASGAAEMRYRVDAGEYSPWLEYAEDMSVDLAGNDGTRTVSMQFTNDASESVSPVATDDIVLDRVAPTATTVVTPGFSLRSGEVTFSGSVTDDRSGVESVRVLLVRNGRYWDGLTWNSQETSLPAQLDGDAWTLPWTPDSVSALGYDPVQVTAVSVDRAGNESPVSNAVVSEDPKEPTSVTVMVSTSLLASYGQTATIDTTLTAPETGLLGMTRVRLVCYDYVLRTTATVYATTTPEGHVRFTVRPPNKTKYRVEFAGDGQYLAGSSQYVAITPVARVMTPRAPSLMYRTRYYSVYGYLYPRHAAGTYPVRIYADRYVSGSWKRYAVYYRARAYNIGTLAATDYRSSTKYVASVRLPYAGKWRIRAYHVADTGHPAAWSSGYDYITVR